MRHNGISETGTQGIVTLFSASGPPMSVSHAFAFSSHLSLCSSLSPSHTPLQLSTASLQRPGARRVRKPTCLRSRGGLRYGNHTEPYVVPLVLWTELTPPCPSPATDRKLQSSTRYQTVCHRTRPTGCALGGGLRMASSEAKPDQKTGLGPLLPIPYFIAATSSVDWRKRQEWATREAYGEQRPGGPAKRGLARLGPGLSWVSPFFVLPCGSGFQGQERKRSARYSLFEA